MRAGMANEGRASRGGGGGAAEKDDGPPTSGEDAMEDVAGIGIDERGEGEAGRLGVGGAILTKASLRGGGEGRADVAAAVGAVEEGSAEEAEAQEEENAGKLEGGELEGVGFDETDPLRIPAFVSARGGRGGRRSEVDLAREEGGSCTRSLSTEADDWIGRGGTTGNSRRRSNDALAATTAETGEDARWLRERGTGGGASLVGRGAIAEEG